MYWGDCLQGPGPHQKLCDRLGSKIHIDLSCLMLDLFHGSKKWVVTILKGAVDPITQT